MAGAVPLPVGQAELLEMIALVEAPQHDEFHEDTDDRRNREPGQKGKAERTGPILRPSRREGAYHVERAMRQIDEAHDAEYQRQSCRQQKQHHAELQTVEHLLEQQGRHGGVPTPRINRPHCIADRAATAALH